MIQLSASIGICSYNNKHVVNICISMDMGIRIHLPIPQIPFPTHEYLHLKNTRDQQSAWCICSYISKNVSEYLVMQEDHLKQQWSSSTWIFHFRGYQCGDQDPVAHFHWYAVNMLLQWNLYLHGLEDRMMNSCPLHYSAGALSYEYVYLGIRIQQQLHHLMCIN